MSGRPSEERKEERSKDACIQHTITRPYYDFTLPANWTRPRSVVKTEGTEERLAQDVPTILLLRRRRRRRRGAMDGTRPATITTILAADADRSVRACVRACVRGCSISSAPAIALTSTGSNTSMLLLLLLLLSSLVLGIESLSAPPRRKDTTMVPRRCLFLVLCWHGAWTSFANRPACTTCRVTDSPQEERADCI